MKTAVQRVILIFSFFISSLAMASSPFPTDEPMGGKTFGTSAVSYTHLTLPTIYSV